MRWILILNLQESNINTRTYYTIHSNDWILPEGAVAAHEWTLYTAALHASSAPSHPRRSPLVSHLYWPPADSALWRLGKQISSIRFIFINSIIWLSIAVFSVTRIRKSLNPWVHALKRYAIELHHKSNCWNSHDDVTVLHIPWLSNFSMWFLSFLHCCRMLLVSCSRACSHDWSRLSLLLSPVFSSPSESACTKQK